MLTHNLDLNAVLKAISTIKLYRFMELIGRQYYEDGEYKTMEDVILVKYLGPK